MWIEDTWLKKIDSTGLYQSEMNVSLSVRWEILQHNRKSEQCLVTVETVYWTAWQQQFVPVLIIDRSNYRCFGKLTFSPVYLKVTAMIDGIKCSPNLIRLETAPSSFPFFSPSVTMLNVCNNGTGDESYFLLDFCVLYVESCVQCFVKSVLWHRKQTQRCWCVQM